LLSSLAALFSLVWLAVEPGAEAVWTTAVALAVAMASWIAEQLGVKRIAPRQPAPRLLVGGFVAVTVLYFCVALATVAVVLGYIGSLQLAGSAMSPTIANGERLLYHKRVRPERLRRGAVIVFKLSDRAGWGHPGTIVVSRILAVPGDELAIRDGKYLVSGSAGPACGDNGQYVPVIEVPNEPVRITVPADSYFVVQVSPGKAFDSRVLSWVRREEIASTQLYHIRSGAFLKPLD
jgi:signal peptidase I